MGPTHLLTTSLGTLLEHEEQDGEGVYTLRTGTGIVHLNASEAYAIARMIEAHAAGADARVRDLQKIYQPQPLMIPQRWGQNMAPEARRAKLCTLSTGTLERELAESIESPGGATDAEIVAELRRRRLVSDEPTTCPVCGGPLGIGGSCLRGPCHDCAP